MGSIGTEVARRVRVFGMHVLATKRHPSSGVMKELGVEFLGGPDDLDKLLKESDFVVLSVSSTAQTQGLIAIGELKLMRESAFIINGSRGSIIQEDPLFRAQ